MVWICHRSLLLYFVDGLVRCAFLLVDEIRRNNSRTSTLPVQAMHQNFALVLESVVNERTALIKMLEQIVIG